MHDELQALDQNNTWSVLRLSKDKHAMGSRWVFKTKFKSDGSIKRYKAHFMAQGYTQTFGIDYKETFALVAKMNIVRVLISVAVNNRWLMCQMDVKNAFLHGNLKEEIYMKLPSGHLQSSNPNLVCRLHKSIYRLKQSPRAWHAQLIIFLKDSDFKRSNANSSLFFQLGPTTKVIFLSMLMTLLLWEMMVTQYLTSRLFCTNVFPLKTLAV